MKAVTIRVHQPVFPISDLRSSNTGLRATGITKDGASIFDRCGVAKYWCMAGPTSEIYTTSVGRGGGKYDYGHGSTDLVKDPPVAEHYSGYGGTSASAPHITASLALVMARYPYMTNTQARDVLFTTATHLNDSRVVNDNPAAPNTTFGWGKPDLKWRNEGPWAVPGSICRQS